MKRVKPDELEISVTYRAMKYSYAFMFLGIFGYYIYHYVRFNELPHFLTVVVGIQGSMFLILRQLFLHKMTTAKKHEKQC